MKSEEAEQLMLRCRCQGCVVVTTLLVSEIRLYSNLVKRTQTRVVYCDFVALTKAHVRKL